MPENCEASGLRGDMIMNGGGKQLVNIEEEYNNKDSLPALYVHWPWCISKCPYCDFNSHVRRVFDEADYVRAICREIDYLIETSDELVEGSNDRPRLGSIFFGGGTPSLMRADTVERILAHAACRFDFADDIEITLEANPSSVEARGFADLAKAGVNRLSLGVQALDDEALKVLGRAHGVEEALQAIRLADRYFGRMSFDVIYARHGQKLRDWQQELHRVIDLARGHLSLYQLTIEEGTKYKNLYDRGELDLPDNDRAARFFHTTREICGQAGLPAYEVSNHAVPGQESRHNLVYWRYGICYGVGPGAHGRLLKAGRRMATMAIRSPKRWIDQVNRCGHGFESMEVLEPQQQADEILLMGMRLSEGVDLQRLYDLTGCCLDSGAVDALIEAELVLLSPDKRFLRATDAGFSVLNGVIENLSLALQRNQGTSESSRVIDISCQ